jgi:hypothetical protein
MHVPSAKWNALFKTRHPAAKPTSDRVIINDILLFAIHLLDLLNYLEWVLVMCQKHPLALKLSKCDFREGHAEYVSHDLTSDGKCPSKSKFEMITDWPLPPTGQGLNSLIQLCNFCNKCCPWLDLKLKPLQCLIQLYYRKLISVSLWTPELHLLFNEVKVGITSSPCLACYDCAKPIFLKMDWSADGFGSILMQPEDSPGSVAAPTRLLEEEICNFDVAMGGACLRSL